GYSDYADRFVEENCYEDILSFKGPRGTLVIYDSYGIHRAKPVKRDNFARKSVLFQVDGALEASEPLLVNPEYLDNLDDRIQRYLGFGRPSGICLYPQTDLSTMPLSRQNEVFQYFIRRFSEKIARAPAKMFPRRIKSVIKSVLRSTSTS